MRMRARATESIGRIPSVTTPWPMTAVNDSLSYEPINVAYITDTMPSPNVRAFTVRNVFGQFCRHAHTHTHLRIE